MIRKERALTNNVVTVHDSDREQYCCPNPKPTRKRCLFDDVDFEELPSSAGRYSCPYGNCIYSNYVFGFESRTDRNKHMCECPYRDGNVALYVSSDGQMPSAKLIDDLIDTFQAGGGNTDLKKILFKSRFLKKYDRFQRNEVYRIESDIGNNDVNSYEELGRLMFENDCDKNGGGCGCGGDGSCERGKGVQFSTLDKNLMVVRRNEGSTSQVGFQVGVIDEFLNEKSYLLDDDICLE